MEIDLDRGVCFDFRAKRVISVIADVSSEPSGDHCEPEGVSLSAGEKSGKCIVITQLASDKPTLRHELNSDQESDDNKKNGKELASESDSEEIQSAWNSEEELFPEPKTNENNAQFISFIKQFVRMQGIAPNPRSDAEAVESPWDSEEETTTPASGKSENEISVIRDTPEEEGNCKLFCNGELDKDHISDMVCTLRSEDEPVRSTSKPKEETSIPTTGKNEKNMDIVLTVSGEHTKDKSPDANGSPKDNTMDTTSSLRSDDEPVISTLKSECISRKSLKKDADGPMGAGKREDKHEQLEGKYKEKTIQERISKNFVGHYNDIEYKLSEPELENANFSIHNDINTILMEVEENPAISESDQQQSLQL
ncbi:uncharacterized protein LOC121161590 [Ochotona curzoniae]|uniref:uncharacterized protein LOC121161590 n=1 Tax=Ochotona curzoniae TaxID=130825 RepID=UPI001B35324B|nr:uncharacterized protein LOC121161590 [Ochotona curzoniae]